MGIRKGIDEAHRKVAFSKTEARSAICGYNIDVPAFGLVGVIIAFMAVLPACARGLWRAGAGTIPPPMR